AGVQPELESDLLAEEAREDAREVHDDLIDVKEGALDGVAACEREELARELRPFMARFNDLMNQGAALGIDAAFEDRACAEDHGEKVVEIVRDSSGEPPECLDALRFTEASFGLKALKRRAQHSGDGKRKILEPFLEVFIERVGCLDGDQTMR